jgi:hypothetical protein
MQRNRRKIATKKGRKKGEKGKMEGKKRKERTKKQKKPLEPKKGGRKNNMKQTKMNNE